MNHFSDYTLSCLRAYQLLKYKYALISTYLKEYNPNTIFILFFRLSRELKDSAVLGNC